MVRVEQRNTTTVTTASATYNEISHRTTWTAQQWNVAKLEKQLQVA